MKYYLVTCLDHRDTREVPDGWGGTRLAPTRKEFIFPAKSAVQSQAITLAALPGATNLKSKLLGEYA